MEESLQARVSLEQIFSLPELKVPGPPRPPHPPGRQSLSHSGLSSLQPERPPGMRAFPKSLGRMIWNGVFQIGILETHSWRAKRSLVL